jgi:hypothetical protein
MNNILTYIQTKYNVPVDADSPILLPHTREDMARLLSELKFTVGAEIGVSSGNYSKVLCENNSFTKFFCIDSWTTKNGYFDAGSGEYSMKMRYKRAKEKLVDYPCEFIQKTSMQAVVDFAPNTLDFVYIDADHTFDFVMQDIIEWTKKVKRGGVVSGHDYRCYHHDEISEQVSKAVLLYTQIHNIKPLFIFNADHSSTWMFVKPE